MIALMLFAVRSHMSVRASHGHRDLYPGSMDSDAGLPGRGSRLVQAPPDPAPQLPTPDPQEAAAGSESGG